MKEEPQKLTAVFLEQQGILRVLSGWSSPVFECIPHGVCLPSKHIIDSIGYSFKSNLFY